MIQEGKIAGAGLDVFQHEPAVNPKLVKLAAKGKVVILPHMGSATIEGRIDMGEKVIINIRAFIDGHRPPDRVLPNRKSSACDRSSAVVRRHGDAAACEVTGMPRPIELDGDRRLPAHLARHDQAEQQDRVGFVQHERRWRTAVVHQLEQHGRRPMTSRSCRG